MAPQMYSYELTDVYSEPHGSTLVFPLERNANIIQVAVIRF